MTFLIGLILGLAVGVLVGFVGATLLAARDFAALVMEIGDKL